MQPVSVMVVDDSAVVRGLIARALSIDPGIVVSGTARHGEAALRRLRKIPVDVVVLDVDMPVMDGLTALRRIIAEFPQVQVIMASSLTCAGAETTIQALELGAADCIVKPRGRNTAESIDELLRTLVPLVKELGTRKTSAASEPGPPVLPPEPKRPQREPRLLVIGTSAGGPNALSVVLSQLPADFPLPILIVQHMPVGSTPMLAKHLAEDGGRPCAEAVDGETIERGRSYVAPGDYHLLVDKADGRTILRLNQAEPEHYCRPSVNPLFRTAAEWYGKTLVGVMLTGMGADGIEGTRLLVEKGGYMIAQDEATSVVWGMPGAVVEEGLAHEIQPLNQVAESIQRVCMQEVHN